MGIHQGLELTRNRFKTGRERSFVEVTLDYFLGALEYTLTDKPEKQSGRIKDYGAGTINNEGIKRVKELYALIETYSPDIKDENREAFIAKAREQIPTNEYVKKVLAMSERSG